MKLMDRRVKIVCTIGPSSMNEETLTNLIVEGLNVARVLKLTENDTIATGLVGGNIGKFIISELDKEGIKNDFLNF